MDPFDALHLASSQQALDMRSLASRKEERHGKPRSLLAASLALHSLRVLKGLGNTRPGGSRRHKRRDAASLRKESSARACLLAFYPLSSARIYGDSSTSF